MTEPIRFDEYAAHYDAALGRGISLSGEDKEYFARGRIDWLNRCLQGLSERPRVVMDYGCGLGSSTSLFLDLLGADHVVGVDTSPGLLDLAKCECGSERAEFHRLDQYHPSSQIDLAYCNGVFHHIPPRDRPGVVDYIFRSLHPGGLFACWENNPWNPGTRLVMARIPFDRDAVTLSAPQGRRLLQTGGFEILRTDFLFIFPKLLKRLRKIEPWVSALPLGAQFQILCRRPVGSRGFSHDQ